MNTAPGGGASLAEVRLCLDLGGRTVTGGGTASASSTFSGSYLPANAFDGNLSNLWSAAASDKSAWLEYDFGVGNAFAIQYVVLIARNDGFSNYSPTAFSLQSSDDNATWTAVATPSAAGWTNGSTQAFNFIPGPPGPVAGASAPFPRLGNTFLYEPDPALDTQSPLTLARRRVAASIQPQATLKVDQAIIEAIGFDPSVALIVSSTIREVLAANPSPSLLVGQAIMEVIISTQQRPDLIVRPAMVRLRVSDIDRDEEVVRPRRSFAPPSIGGLIDYAISVIT